MHLNSFTQKIFQAANEIPSLGTIIFGGEELPLYKGELHQTEDQKRFTYIKVDDAFITKLTKVAQEHLNPEFQIAPYLSKGLVGAHISLMEGKYPKKLPQEDKGKEVYFYLKPINVWDWHQQGGSLLNGRVLAAVVSIVGGEGKNVMEEHGFSTPHPHHITFAIKPNMG